MSYFEARVHVHACDVTARRKAEVTGGCHMLDIGYETPGVREYISRYNYPVKFSFGSDPSGCNFQVRERYETPAFLPTGISPTISLFSLFECDSTPLGRIS